jgi:superoxide reductase
MLGNKIQHADWKKEKHVPVIDCPDTVAADEMFTVTLTLGKEIAHPNTTEHHIDWIALYFLPEGDKFAHDVATFGFNAHGASVQGPNEGPVYAHHQGTLQMKINKPGTLNAVAYCNIHGLWESSKQIQLR